MIHFNSYIYNPEIKEVINIEYDTSHLLYYWYRFIFYLIKTNPNKLFKKFDSEITNFLFVLEEDIETPSFYKALTAFYKNQAEIKPLISIGNFDLNSIKEETYLPVDFLDSCIWNFYISVINNGENEQNTDFKGKLEKVLLTVNQHYENKLYNTIIAKEFIEFQSRLLGNAYLGLPGGHAAAVVPFVFHSETKMSTETEKFLVKIKNLTHSGRLSENEESIRKLFDIIKDLINSERLSKNEENAEKLFDKIKGLIYSGWLSENEKNIKTLFCLFKSQTYLSWPCENEKDINKFFEIIKNLINSGKLFENKENAEKFFDKIKGLIYSGSLSENEETIKKLFEIINYLIQNIQKTTIKWNVLFIDDYANRPLRGGQKTKQQILESLFGEIKNLLKPKGISAEFPITPCVTIEEAGTKINNEQETEDEKTQYDIILLDYLLGQKSGTSNKREYGDEFLLKLKNDDELLKHRGPLGKFWIFPVTSFSNAMLSKLEEVGIGRIEDAWYIFDGADMINTPELFKYNFLQLIYLQLNTAIVTKEDIAGFIMENKTDNDKTDKKNNDKDLFPMREKARRLYGVFMHKFGLRGALKYDEGQGSEFAKSVSDYMFKERFEDLRFYENVRKLLYLVGYGTHADASLMWDLLTYVESVISEEKNKDIMEGFLKNVRDYITGLKQLQ